MPQLDFDIMEDFLFIGIIAFTLGYVDDSVEENCVNITILQNLHNYYATTTHRLLAEHELICNS